MTDPLRLVVNQELPKRACCDCEYVRGPRDMAFARCAATGFFVTNERAYTDAACGKAGKLWTPRRPKAGIFVRVWRALFGKAA